MTRKFRLAALVFVLAASVAAAGCGDDDDDKAPDGGTTADGGDGGDTDGGADDGGVVPTGAGLSIELQEATVPETGSPTVTFKLTDAQGKPITDLATEIANEESTATPKPEPRMRPRYSLAQREDDGTFTHLYEGEVASKAFTGGTPALAKALQPRTQPGSPFPVASLDATRAADGIYRLTLVEPTTDAAKRDRARTHRLGIWATRTASGVATPVSATKDFNPSGGAVTSVQTVTNAACNQCHTNGVTAHDNRRTVELCVTCHAGDRDATYQDPETGADIDMRVMIHKIHSGSALPSVRQGDKYEIVGFGQRVFDFGELAFPRDVRECTVCHQGSDANRWKSRPSLEACASCHDNVKFDSSAGATCATAGGTPDDCNHVVPLPAAQNCAQCHNEAAITAKHVPLAEQASKYRFEILDASLDASRKPVVKFRVVDTTNNQNVDIKTNPEFNQGGGASRLAVDIGWPADEYTNAPAVGTMAYGQPLQEADAKTAATANADGTYTLTFATELPTEVTGTATAVLEGHPATTTGVRLPVPTAVKYFNVAGGAATPRREVVSVDNCNRCHGQLTAHGFNRNDSTEVCVVCHNTNATDKARRPGGVSGESSVWFPGLIHLIHGSPVHGEDKVDIYGFGGNKFEFPKGFTGDAGNCKLCHVDTTFNLPLNAAIKQGPTIDSKGTPSDYADNERLPPTTAICTSCHRTVSLTDSSRPLCNTVAAGTECAHSGGLNLPDTACAGCHGPSGTVPVAKAHPIR